MLNFILKLVSVTEKKESDSGLQVPKCLPSSMMLFMVAGMFAAGELRTQVSVEFVMMMSLPYKTHGLRNHG